MILVTPNPALDRTLVIPSLRPGEVHRAEQVTLSAGGKGVNAARAVRLMGGNPLLLAPLGGKTGASVDELVRNEGIRASWTHIENETRTCVILMEESCCRSTVINESGPLVSLSEWKNFRNTGMDFAEVEAGCVAFCGSLPPGIPESELVDQLIGLKAIGKEVWVDSSGAALRAAVGAKPTGIKINAMEAAELVRMPITTYEDAGKAALIILQRIEDGDHYPGCCGGCDGERECCLAGGSPKRGSGQQCWQRRCTFGCILACA